MQLSNPICIILKPCPTEKANADVIVVLQASIKSMQLGHIQALIWTRLF